MTVQSAASALGLRPGTQRAPIDRRRIGLSVEPATIGKGLPPGRFPVSVVAGDMPGANILVVHDDAVIALDLQRILKTAGYRIVGPATSAREAEDLVRHRPIDGAVLDLGNGGSAIAVADLLALSHIPFVILSCLDETELPARHADRPFVRKPYTAHHILSAVQRAMSGAGNEDQGIHYPVAPPQVTWPRVFPQL